MASILSVSQINRYVSFKLKEDVKLRSVAVSGEISNLSVHYKSGHIYFTLKDDSAALKAVMFSSNTRTLRFVPQNGMKVVALGNIELYERDGVCQLVCMSMSPVGEGNKALELEALKQKLSAVGVFSENIKKPIPPTPNTIAIVTSPTGAALQDILNVIKRRYPIAKVFVSPATVQGEQAPDSIANAVENADKLGCDVMLIARGGGSAEDLMAFNTEKVVMSVYNCVTPVISAVGHETDTTLCDYAADMRAPTPSAAAEIAVPVSDHLRALINGYDFRIKNSLEKKILNAETEVSDCKSRLEAFSPSNRLEAASVRLNSLRDKMKSLIEKKHTQMYSELSSEYSKLEALNPLSVLSRGFAVVRGQDGEIISKYKVKSGDEISIRTCDLELSAVVGEVKEL